MKLRFEAELVEAVQFVVKPPQDLDTYAKNFLAIFNNVRDYGKDFLKIENYPTSKVAVTCKVESKKEVKDFLEWYGEIVAERKVFVYRPELVCSKAVDEYIDKMLEKTDSYEIVGLEPEIE